MCLERLYHEDGHLNGAATTNRLRLDKDQRRLHRLQLLPNGHEVRLYDDSFGVVHLSVLQFPLEALPLSEESSSRHGVTPRSLESFTNIEHTGLKVDVLPSEAERLT
jgi:hypothetical protein